MSMSYGMAGPEDMTDGWASEVPGILGNSYSSVLLPLKTRADAIGSSGPACGMNGSLTSSRL